MRSPVVFIIFNRPDVTTRVFARIREARPPRLLVVADGARPGRAGEAERCAETRRLVLEGVDWPCEVQTCLSEANLGCRRRVSSGLGWAFAQAERAIILEDDCLPDPGFFRFCDELLDRYADDERVGHIAGTDFTHSVPSAATSYRWARYYPIWGWASWRRCWRDYDVDMGSWAKSAGRERLPAVLPPGASTSWWRETFDRMHAGFDTWDCQLVWANWRARRLAAIPSVNLISNIGFGAGATHTHRRSPLADLPSTAIPFPLTHPEDMIPDVSWERLVSRQQYARPWLLRRIADVARRLRR